MRGRSRARRITWRRFALAVVRSSSIAIAAALAACSEPGSAVREGGAAPAPSIATAPPIELFTWWARVGESDAFGALMREHTRRHPGDVLINATAELSGAARKTLRTRMFHHEPPETFQANIGEDLMQWVLLNGLDARESVLVPLDGKVPEAAELRRVVPRRLLERLSYDGKLYAIPSNVHRINTVFYNKAVLDRFGMTEPRSVDDFSRMASKLEGSGVDLIALGSRDPWTLALFVFECLMVAAQGPAFYADYFDGNLRADDPRVEHTLELALELLEFVNDDHAQLSWLAALERVVAGKAAMTVMGDWARVSFNAHGLRPGREYGELAFPGSERVFVFTSDTFPLPKLAKNRDGAIRLLGTMASRDGQRAMNVAKGSLSARSDVEPPDDPVLREKADLLRRGELVLALSGAVPARFAEDVAAALAEMAASNNIEPVMHTLRSRYALLK